MNCCTSHIVFKFDSFHANQLVWMPVLFWQGLEKCTWYGQDHLVSLYMLTILISQGHVSKLIVFSMVPINGIRKKEIFSPACIQLISCVGLATVDTDNSLTEVLCNINKYLSNWTSSALECVNSHLEKKCNKMCTVQQNIWLCWCFEVTH